MIHRLADIITGGFVNPVETAWAQFLVRGLYDPRLLIFIFDFVVDEEKS